MQFGPAMDMTTTDTGFAWNSPEAGVEGAVAEVAGVEEAKGIDSGPEQ